MIPNRLKERYTELIDKSYVIFDEADELDLLAKRLGKVIVWQHKVLVIGDVETKEFIRYVPCGEMTCPKPLTYNDYIFARNNYAGEKK